jgi:hypothetical protein
MATLAAVAAFALLLVGGAGPAAAQGKPLTQVVKMTAKAKNGKKFTGTYTISRFTQSGGKVYAVGTLKGKLKGRTVRKSNVRIPATLARHPAAGASQVGLPPNPTAGACQILDLTLEPINLNLLGLHLVTSRIEVLLEAIPGAGNLLGNLLCGITNLLNPGSLSGTPLGQLTQILNALLALAPKTA